MQEVSGSSPLSPTTSIPHAERGGPAPRKTHAAQLNHGPTNASLRNAMSANPSAEAKELTSQLAPGAAEDPYYEIRHSCAHVLAAALKRLFPGTRLGVGPPVEDGFYYDVAPPRPITADDLP